MPPIFFPILVPLFFTSSSSASSYSLPPSHSSSIICFFVLKPLSTEAGFWLLRTPEPQHQTVEEKDCSLCPEYITLLPPPPPPPSRDNALNSTKCLDRQRRADQRDVGLWSVVEIVSATDTQSSHRNCLSGDQSHGTYTNGQTISMKGKQIDRTSKWSPIFTGRVFLNWNTHVSCLDTEHAATVSYLNMCLSKSKRNEATYHWCIAAWP